LPGGAAALRRGLQPLQPRAGAGLRDRAGGEPGGAAGHLPAREPHLLAAAHPARFPGPGVLMARRSVGRVGLLLGGVLAGFLLTFALVYLSVDRARSRVVEER